MVARIEEAARDAREDLEVQLSAVAAERDALQQRVGDAEAHAASLSSALRDLEGARVREERQAALDRDSAEEERRRTLQQHKDREFLTARNTSLQKRLQAALSGLPLNPMARAAHSLAARATRLRLLAPCFSSWARLSVRAGAVDAVLHSVAEGCGSHRLALALGHLKASLRYRSGAGSYSALTAVAYRMISRPHARTVSSPSFLKPKTLKANALSKQKFGGRFLLSKR